MMKLGNVVKFKDPINAGEAAERHVVIELRGNRVLVEFVCNMNFKPMGVYLIDDMEVVK